MKHWLRILSLLIALSMVMALPMAAMADEGEIETQEENENLDNEEVKESKGKAKGKDKVKDQNKEWKVIKEDLEIDKDTLEGLKDELELKIQELELELEELLAAAEETDSSEAIDSLQAEIEGLKGEFDGYKTLMKQKIREMQQVMREKYTQEEWNVLMENAEELEGLEDIKMLPAENILMPGKNLKFDVPPVIKEGRVLVPIRSISTALGAEVSWSEETKVATINYEGSVIEFNIDEMKVTVDGGEIQLDVPAELMEGRIVVPLRFIVENMGLKVEWEPETQTVGITE